MKTISEATLLPISLVITLLGGAGWLTTIWHDTQANAQAIDMIMESRAIAQKDNRAWQSEVIQRLTRIEERVNRRGH